MSRGRHDVSRSQPSELRFPVTTFLPPRLPPDVVDRRRLVARLGPAAASRLSLVVGPPGSGKSTLVAAWLGSVDGPRAWLTIDADVGRADRFWAALVGALVSSCPELVLDASDLIDTDHTDGAAIVRAIVDDLTSAPQLVSLVAVLDDAHVLEQEVWTDLAWLIEHQPPNVHLVIASRVDPPISMARWRAAGLISEVRGSDLAFDVNETVTLFSQFEPTAHQPPDVATQLWERTEGWAAGLRLALLALRDGGDPRQLVDHFSGTHRSIAELLMTEVLARQSVEVRDFLHRTSILSALEPTICDALSDRDDSRAVLRHLAADHVFITPVDGEVDRYRYHPLFADLLRYEMHTEQPDLETDVHGRASRFYAGSGQTAEAIDHALEAGDYAAACALINDALASLYADGRRSEVSRWLDAIPDEFLLSEPDRAVAQCAALLFLGRVEWIRWMQIARRALDDSRPDLQARLLLFEAIGHATQGRVEAFADRRRQAQQLRPDGLSEPYEEFATGWHARALSLVGRHEDAIDVATALLNSERSLMTDAAATSLVAGVLHLAGRDDAAAAAADRAIGMWRDLGEPDLLGMVDALCVLAAQHRAAGDLASAEMMALIAASLCGEPPPHLLTIRATRELAALDQTAAQARARLANVAERCREIGSDPRLLRLVDADLDASFRSDTTDEALGTHGERLVEPLTERETAILRLLQSNLTYPEIGTELYISRHTVKTHVVHIYRKLGVPSRSAAVNEARRIGLLGTNNT